MDCVYWSTQGLLVNRSRDIVRQACTQFPPEDQESKAMMARWTVVFTRVLRMHLQPEVTIETELGSLVTQEEMQVLREAPHR